jgi:integrase/recombinase XerD
MKVNITKHVEVEGKSGKRFCRVNPKNGDAIVSGQPVKTGGKYYIDFVENGRRRRLAAGNDFRLAQAMADKQSKLTTAHRAAADAGIDLSSATEAAITGHAGRSLRDTIKEFLIEVKEQKKSKTHSGYRTALEYFVQSCPKTTLEELTRGDMLHFKTYLKKTKNQSDRSCHNKFACVMSFLKRYEISTKLKLTKHDWPTFVEEEVEIYTEEQITRFFDACTRTEKLWFTFFLETGMREQEVMHVSWSDVDFERSVVTVRENKRFNWQPKKNKGRLIAIPTALVSMLKSLKEDREDATCGLVFPTSGCRPKNDFLDCCKAIAKRDPKLVPADFWLHKFRATRITNWLRAGIDLRSVQNMAGHSDLESTSRYLKSQEIDNLVQQVNEAATAGGAR